ncbi:class I SAM-dependent methyltransferase [Streptomyces aureoverticillatus]|uniref:class I SAM-dependent methyltransferase n=1 Tax=Streptomyces aureoverticillatus TaxID=66871 RepID=UPI0013DA4271|nr:class I SAM-dependent methyltransferase [Streptomyces aureoverticillatus]QIB43952.1 class I SAM-dependent methyltransferase [Streptomyces aureoverticillatus]
MPAAHDTSALPQELSDVPGWFPNLDQVLFDWLLTRQESRGVYGDLLEIGVYMGKSAIFLGRHLRDGEDYTVCDLFEDEAPDGANEAESNKSYPTLTKQAFERNYLSFHDELPRVLRGPSSVVPDKVTPKSCRFVHVDASHLYEHVHGDIGAARDTLLPGGVVVLDDFRSEHTPGVSIAAWEAVLNRGLKPICLSTQKLYGTWDDPEPVQEELLAMVREREDCHLSVQEAAGHRIVRVKSKKGMRAPEFPPSRHYRAPDPAAHSAPQSPAAGSRRSPATHARARRIAADLLPPVVTRAVRRGRAK